MRGTACNSAVGQQPNMYRTSILEASPVQKNCSLVIYTYVTVKTNLSYNISSLKRHILLNGATRFSYKMPHHNFFSYGLEWRRENEIF